ncbi:hypothetical protein ACMD2_08023 [Ananas comosus]|uniref:Reverse transcriptase zinc-binding domain-containing protein n=1 Tax=Ananas comosus TaxID=4615 RepID=A0A199VFE8_ANACO|nr:hypothetical protein ACMD2_08023 [Ananas comosus]
MIFSNGESPTNWVMRALLTFGWITGVGKPPYNCIPRDLCYDESQTTKGKGLLQKILGVETAISPGLRSNLSALRERVCRYKVVQRPDTILRRWCSNEHFSIRSVYTMLSDGGIRDALLKKRPLTADNLVKRGWTGDTACVLCRSHEETVDHLFT